VLSFNVFAKLLVSMLGCVGLLVAGFAN